LGPVLVLLMALSSLAVELTTFPICRTIFYKLVRIQPCTMYYQFEIL